MQYEFLNRKVEESMVLVELYGESQGEGSVTNNGVCGDVNVDVGTVNAVACG